MAVSSDSTNLRRPLLPSLHLLRSFNFHYFWDGTHLRVRPGGERKSQWSKEQIAKDGWYVTADYSVSPPRVILTKEPTKDSRWSFLSASNRRTQYHIKNENDRGKDAWLHMMDTGKRYSAGRYRDVRVFMAVLSFRIESTWQVIDIEDTGK